MAGIARIRTIVLDCPDPLALARFYGELLGWEVDLRRRRLGQPRRPRREAVVPARPRLRRSDLARPEGAAAVPRRRDGR